MYLVVSRAPRRKRKLIYYRGYDLAGRMSTLHVEGLGSNPSISIESQVVKIKN